MIFSFSVLLRCAIEYMFRFIESDTLNKYAHQNAKKETMFYGIDWYSLM